MSTSAWKLSGRSNSTFPRARGSRGHLELYCSKFWVSCTWLKAMAWVQACFMCLCSPWPQSYPRDAVLTANEWQVHPSPAKSCNGFKVSSYITSTHIPLLEPEQGCGQAQSQWNRERHSVHAGRGVNVFSRTPDYHKVLGNSTWSLCRVLWSHKERSQHFSLVEISISEDVGVRLSLENEASIVHWMGKMRIMRGECKDRWRPL